MTTEPVRSTFGSRLRAYRRSKGKTIAQVADASGLSLPYISNLERGRGNPTVGAINRLAEALGIGPSQLVGDRELPEGDETQEALLAAMPPSLASFSRTDEFQRTVTRLSTEHGLDETVLRRRLLSGMAAAPRRGQGEPTATDWRRLLDVYTIILQQ